jgi:integrase
MRRKKAPTFPFYFTDESIATLPFAGDHTGYVARDSKLSGFMCQVGLRTKRLIFRTEIREGGSRQVIYKRLGDPAHVKLDEARAQALEELARATRIGKPEARAGTTMAEAWAAYRARLEKKQRSARTIEDYEQKWRAHIEPTFGKRALRDITRADAIRLHERLSRNVGPYAANGTCRVAHAVYRHAALALEVPGLPALNPFRSYDLHNKETPRQTGIAEKELPGLFEQMLAIRNPVRREFWVMTLLSGLRRSDVQTMQWDHVNLKDGYIFLPGPKGGPERAFRIPISAAMRRCLERAKQAGKLVAEPQAKTWVFPSESSDSGHVEEPKGDVEGRSPHALRHTFRGMCAGAKVAKLHSRLLMNHKISNDIHDEYMSVPAMFDQLREASEAAGAYITKHLPKGAWRALDRRLREDVKGPS